MIKKISLILVLVLMLSMSLIGCEPEYVGDGSSIYDNIEISDFKNNRTDKQPLIDRFEKLGDFESCVWQSGVIDSGRSDIGPSSAWLKGYIVLKSDQFETIKSQYNWIEVDEIETFASNIGVNNSDIPELDISSLNLENSNWASSENFDDEILEEGYIGIFYLDLNNQVIMFELEN